MSLANARRGVYTNGGKRTADFILSGVLLVLLLPLLMLLALLIAFIDQSPPLFRQVRIGRNEEQFFVLKFRTMNDRRNAEGRLLPDGERLTRAGRVLRRLSLDELPQLANVLRGEMSFIGPRPLLVRYLPYYAEEERIRHSVRPGITGLAQVSGRNNLGWDARLSLDVEYVQQMSLRSDIRILMFTLGTLASSSGVNVDVHSEGLEDLDVERG